MRDAVPVGILRTMAIYTDSAARLHSYRRLKNGQSMANALGKNLALDSSMRQREDTQKEGVLIRGRWRFAAPGQLRLAQTDAYRFFDGMERMCSS